MRARSWIGLFLFLLVSSARAIAPGQQFQVVTGSNTAAGITCTMTGVQASSYTVLLDGTSVATSTITVAVQVLDVNNNTYVTPSGLGNPNIANPVTVTNATVSPLIQIPGPLAGIQVNVTSFGTATGTFRATVVAN